jgi:uncharacterized membrane protein HdeD (DUF308 family)
MWNASPWKLSAVAAVEVAAGVKLLLSDWSVAGLGPFVALLFVASGALRIVITRSFTGLSGALTALGAGGDLAIGGALLAWPKPTLSVLALLVGSWIVIRGAVDATIAVATRADYARWLPAFLVVVAQLLLGVALLVRPIDTARAASAIVAVTALLQAALIVAAAFSRQRRIDRAPTGQPRPSVAAVIVEP